MTEIHAGYRVPAEELDEVPMDNYNSRVQTSRPAGEYQRRLNAESYWSFMIRHRLAFVVATLFVAIIIAFIAIATYLASAPGANYTVVEINRLTEVDQPATEEVGDLENDVGGRNRVFTIQSEPFDDIQNTLIEETHRSLPTIVYQGGRMKRMRRGVEEANVESCRKRHEDCKVLLNNVKNMTRNVSQQVLQLQKMINRLGILNEELPTLNNITVLDFANCLQCERLENQTASLDVHEDPVVRNGSRQSQGEDAEVYAVSEIDDEILSKDEGSPDNITVPVLSKYTSMEKTEGFLPPKIAYAEHVVNVTQKNISVVENPDGSKTLYFVRNVTIALTPDSSEARTNSSARDAENQMDDPGQDNQDDFLFRHSSFDGNSASNFEEAEPTDEPEVLQPGSETFSVTEADVSTAQDDSGVSTTSNPDTPSIAELSSVRENYSPEGRSNGEQSPFVIPTAETSKGTLQVTYTPNVGWMPYPVCVYGPPNPPAQSVRQKSSGSIVFPVSSPASSPSQDQHTQYDQYPVSPSTSNGEMFSHTLNFVQPILPGQPIMQPTQQGVQFIQPQRYGPTGPGTQYFPVNQAYHQPTSTGPARPVYCTYLPTPTFQFPVVPGVSEFQRAAPEPGSGPRSSDKDNAETELKSRDYTAGCLPHTRACNDYSQCIPKSRWCDGEVDCDDASDETRCSCRDRVDRERLCDGYFDCPLGEDELGCFGCDKKSFSCDDSENRRRWGNCVPLVQRCDGFRDCENGKDELNCNIITHSVEEREMFTVGYTRGYLHRNWRGKWYPACTASKKWANDACRDEIGEENYRDFPTIETVYLQHDYDGPYVVQASPNDVQIVQSCSNKAVFVNCPKMPCGTRVLSRQDNSFFGVPSSERFPPPGFHQVITDALDEFRSENTKSKEETDGKSRLLETLRTPDVSNTTNDGDHVLKESRVVGGRPSQPKAWPSLVAVNRNGNFHCGGVILDQIWVLTAAHCIDGYHQHYYDIQAGILRRFSYSPMEQSRRVAHIVMYPSYDRLVMKNDLALLRLESPLNFNRWVRPACLPDTMTAGPSWRAGPSPSTTCVSAGWGSIVEKGPDPDHLREVDLPILPNCKYVEDQNEAEICAGMIQGGRDTCQGDSGGPLMCRNPNSPSQWYVAGIVSHGEGCARPNEPGAYTKVSRFVEWINKIRHRQEPPNERPLQRCPGYYCHSGSRRCYPSKRRCDKTVDCMDAEDELNCQRFTDFSSYRFSGSKNANSSINTMGKSNDETSAPETTTAASSAEPSTTVESSITSTEVTIARTTTTETAEKIEPVEISTTVTSATTSEPMEQTEEQSTTVKPDENFQTVTTNRPNITKPSLPPQHFSCRILIQTIDFGKRCDKVVDCEDGTDEENCTCKDYLAKISPGSICDGHIDCSDATDEENCEICSPDEFHCKRSRECVPLAKRCDIKGDCQYNEDELGCLTLTNGKYVIHDIDGMPHHNREGILTSYEKGKWVPFCLDRRPNRPATLGKQMCSYFGFAGCESFNETRVHNVPLEVLASTAANFIPYENASLHSSPDDDEEPRCTALYIRCLQTIHTVSLAYRLKAIDGHEDDTFLWPWHAAVFVDGRYKCSAVLLEPTWLLTSAHCTDDVDLNKNYTTALLGLSRSYLKVDGPHQEMCQVGEIKTVKNSDAVLLRLRYPVHMTRHVQPMYLQKRTQAPAEPDKCATVGVDHRGRTRSVFLRAVLHNCPDDHRCYQNVEPVKCQNETTVPWSGTVVCYGCTGWYPAAVYHEEDGICSFSKKRSFSSIDYINTNLITGMQEPLNETFQEPKCNGFRCPLGNCIDSKKVCDGVPHCRDGSDEEPNYCREIEDHCKNGVHDTTDCHCAQSELRCANGQCVPKSSFCDGKFDCSDESDEPSKCDCASYLRLTAPEKICDGRRHCFDKSDENPDSCHCKDSSFKCDRNADVCVPQDYVCDGQSDCPSGEDEKQCHTLKRLPSDPPGYGEVIERSYGVWHSRCFPAGELSDDKSGPNVCMSLGYSYAKNVTESDASVGPSDLPAVPKFDKFYMVRLNPKAWIVMRDDKAFVSLHQPMESCYRHYVTCA